MPRKTGIWRFSGPLRVLAILMAVIYGAYYLYVWSFALAGDTEDAFDFIDVISTEPLTLIQIAGGMVFSGIAIGAMVLIAIIANRLLKSTYRDGFFKSGVSKTLKQLGYALVLFWLGMILAENFMPWLLTKNLTPELREEIQWFLLDANLVALLVGFVLILVSGAMDEARAIDEDYKQII